MYIFYLHSSEEGPFSVWIILFALQFPSSHHDFCTLNWKDTSSVCVLIVSLSAFSQDEEINEIKSLIGSAVLDSEVKGGLRWPFGEDSSGSRYAVTGVWHTTAKSYGNSSIRLKLRHADRYDFRSSTGEVAQEVNLKMSGILSQLQVDFLLMSNYVYFYW